MNLCKYLLPCGRCDKYDKPCNMSIKDFKNYNILSSKEELKSETKFECNHKKCNHKWELSKNNSPASKRYYVCAYCGAMKEENPSSCYEK